MDFKLSEDQIMLQRAAREFAEKEVGPVGRELDRKVDPKECFSWELIKRASELGFRTAALSEEYGGGGLDLLSLVILVEEAAVADPGFGYTLFHQLIQLIQVNELCNKEQKDEFCPKIVEDDTFLMAHGQTEPSGGTDILLPYDAPGAALKTVAERKGDEYVLNGVKHFISNGAVAKLYTILARTDRKAGITKGASLFLVPAETPGFSIGKIHDKLGLRTSMNAELLLENVRIPSRYLLGEENNGLQASRPALPAVLLCKTSVLTGTLRALYEESLEYAKTRVGGGKPIIEHQTIAMMLADMYVKIEAARLLSWKCAWSEDTQHEHDLKGPISLKAFLNEAGITVARDTLEIFGAFGTDKEMPVEKLVRDLYTQLHGFGTRSIALFKAGSLLAKS